MGYAMRGIADWLASIGLEEHAQRFAKNAIDLSVVRDLTETDLEETRRAAGRFAGFDPGCVKTLRGITAPGILGPMVMWRAKKRKKLSSARHYDHQISFSHDQDPQETCTAPNCCCAK
jgi:hypothetical protein